MNPIYSVLWNQALRCVTSELGRGRSARQSRAAGWAALPALTALALPVQATPLLPTGHALVSGNAAVTESGSQMHIRQNSAKLILDWQSFNIGKHQSVIFQQSHKTDVALNRVVGTAPSSILGKLQADGKVFLVNPNGVLFGKEASVNVGGIIASTLDIANDDFLKGKYAFQGKGRDRQGGSVVNEGDIHADGVALLGGKVSNQGTIVARLGSVALAAGHRISLDFAGDGLLEVQVHESALNALVENKQLINADGGCVLLTAHATNALLQTVVNNRGTIQARTVGARQGRIQLLGSFDGGVVEVAGTLDASAPKAGRGGFIETGGAKVQIRPGTEVTTEAAQGFRGNWLINTTNLASSSDLKAKTNATLQAPNGSEIHAHTPLDGSRNALNVEGRIDVDAPLTWEDDFTLNAHGVNINAPIAWSKNKLTLNTLGRININAVMTGSATAALEMNYSGHAAQGSGVNFALSRSGFTGRMDFNDVLDQSLAANQRLKINGETYTLLTQLGSEGSTTRLDLQGMGGDTAGRYALAADIDARASAGWNGGFMPVGKKELGAFSGKFDGLGHTIHALNIDRPKSHHVGLFGIAKNATLQNVGLVGGSVKGADYVGSLVGGNVGRGQGIAGISRVYSSANVVGKKNVGGLAGWNTAWEKSTASISHSYFTGEVHGKQNAGGLVGLNHGMNNGTASIAHSYSMGQVVGEQSIGGLVGGNSADKDSSASISHSHFTGNVEGQLRVGGLVGHSYGLSNGLARIVHSHSMAQVVGGKHVGGLAGENSADESSTAIISHAYFTGDVKGKGIVGGLVGQNLGRQGTASIAHSYSTGTLHGAEYLGGLVGKNWGSKQGIASISHSYSTAQVIGELHLGSFVGTVVGGLAGQNTADHDATANISYVYATGTVRGQDLTGGLVGQNSAMQNSTANISHAYATGEVPDVNTPSDRQTVGGLIGENRADDNSRATISNAYFDQSSTGQATGSGARSGGIAVTEISQRDQHASYADLGKWTETANNAGIWEAKDAKGVAQWILFEGATRPFLASEYSTTIGNAHQLQLMAYKPDASYTLASDIDASATRVTAADIKQHSGMWGPAGFVPAGNEQAKFTGSLNGQGHVISDLTIDRPTQSNVGLFGYAENAGLHHMTLKNGSVKGADRVGLLVGKNLASNQGLARITDVTVAGQVTGLGNGTGGMVGSNRAKNASVNQIDNAQATVQLIAGMLHAGQDFFGRGAGGLVGNNHAKNGSTVRITNAMVSAQVTAGSNAAGLVGINRAENNSIASIDGAKVEASVSGGFNVGSLIGANVAGRHSSATFANYSAKDQTDKKAIVEPVGLDISAP